MKRLQAELAETKLIWVRVWLDAFGIGLILALAARWYMTAAATDKPVTRVLVVSRCADVQTSPWVLHTCYTDTQSD